MNPHDDFDRYDRDVIQPERDKEVLKQSERRRYLLLVARAQAEAARLSAENTRLRSELAELQVVTAECLTNVAQVFDGWHADGTAWTEWDEAVRHSVGRILAALAEGERDA